MALGFRGGSADALAALRQQLDGVGDVTRAGEDLFAVAALLRAEPSLRRVATDASTDAEAKAGLAQVELMGRLQALTAAETEAVRGRAAEEPDNLDAQFAVADLDVTGGHVEDGLGRIVTFIGRNFGPEREAARVRLLELFDVVGTSDERVAKARQNLARVLF